MPRTLYSPRLSDDVVRLLYQEAKRRQMPMTRLADELLRGGLAVGKDPGVRSGSPGSDSILILFPEAA